MKKRLEPLQNITKSEASYQSLMLQMMSKLVDETRENNCLIKQVFGKDVKSLNKTQYNSEIKFKDRTNIPHRGEDFVPQLLSPTNKGNSLIIEEIDQTYNEPKKKYTDFSDNSYNEASQKERINRDAKIEKVLSSLEQKLVSGQQLNLKMIQIMQKLVTQQDKRKSITKEKEVINVQDYSIIQKAMKDKQKDSGVLNSNLNVNEKSSQKKNYVILSQILPYSDRREMKVKFKISDIMNQQFGAQDDNLVLETSEWLGMVYRATASICWNMLLNNHLTFQEVKILFTENIVFNFIEFMNELSNMGKGNSRQKLTSIINQKSCDILDFLCKQYPQTKIEAPNIALRSLLPQIDNQGRIKYDLISKSGINFSYKDDGDYTGQIMKMINFMIDKSNEQFETFQTFMKNTFEEIYLPIHKRRGYGANSSTDIMEMVHDDLVYREKVKSYTKYLIGRKIAKNTSKYSQQEIQDGIFFVKSTAVLRIITKWVQELMEYVLNPEQKIKESYSENKDHNGKLLYISSLLKNGIYKKILSDRQNLKKKINSIKKQCYKMEMLLTDSSFTTDSTQIHLSQEQISVGKYCSNLKSAISSYICSQLNEVIHYLLEVPKNVNEADLGIELDDFKTQARKDLDSLNLVTFKLFDLLRCKIHSNEEQIIWIVQHLIEQNKINKDRFGIVRIKDRLNLGTRDIMINAQINKGLVCEIQLSVTSSADKKQQLLDQYNHFLYELKRSKLGPLTENVSIWATLEQRYSYFEQLIKQKNNDKPRNPKLHNCGTDHVQTFKRPLICKSCHNFYAIPQTCLLNVECKKCFETYCGDCYYNFLSAQERKNYIFEDDRLLKKDVMDQLIEYNDYSKPLPQTAFFIKKKFLKKQLSFYMAIQKNKDDKIKTAPNIELILVQTIIRNDKILNRQLNKKEIEARLENGQFFVKNYQKTILNSYIIFYFKGNFKKFNTLTDLENLNKKEQNKKIKFLNILKQPSYISKLQLLKKDSDKVKQMNYLRKIINDDKITTYVFPKMIILAQAFVKGSLLRSEITKKVNTSALKAFAYKESDIVSMEHKNMSVQLDEISFKMKPFLFNMFSNNLKKLFLTNGSISSIKCFANFSNLQFVVISQNKLTSLEGIENLSKLVSFRFDENQVTDLIPFSTLTSMKYISGNKNKIGSLKGLANLKELKSLSLFENQIQSIEEIDHTVSLQQLYLRQNPIVNANSLLTLTGLVKLFIGKTKIKQLPDITCLNKLKSLSLEALDLEKIPNIFKEVRLNELWLSNNKITKIQNLESQNQLITLNLSRNKITKIQNVEFLYKIEQLKFDQNEIKVIQNIQTIVDSLKILSLKGNPIDDIKELFKYELSFQLMLTEQSLSENARLQKKQLDSIQENFSSED